MMMLHSACFTYSLLFDFFSIHFVFVIFLIDLMEYKITSINSHNTVLLNYFTDPDTRSRTTKTDVTRFIIKFNLFPWPFQFYPTFFCRGIYIFGIEITPYCFKEIAYSQQGKLMFCGLPDNNLHAPSIHNTKHSLQNICWQISAGRR